MSGQGLKQPSGGADLGSSDGGNGRLVVRLGGVNDLRGVQFRSVVGGASQGAAWQEKQGGERGEAAKVEGSEKGDVQTPGQKGLAVSGVQSPGGSSFGVATQPSVKKIEEGGAAGKTGPNSDGKKPIIKRLRIIPPKEKVGSHPMSPPQMPAPINTPRDRSGGVENKAGDEAGGSGMGRELDAGESRQLAATPETDPNWPQLGARASPNPGPSTVGGNQPSAPQLGSGALFRPQYAPPIVPFPPSQTAPMIVGAKGKAKKGPAKPRKSKGAGSLAAAPLATGPVGQQLGVASSGTLGGASALQGYPRNPQASQPNSAGYLLNPQPNPAGHVLNPQDPPPNPAGHALNPQAPQPNSAGHALSPQAPQPNSAGHALNPQFPHPYSGGYLHNPQAAVPYTVEQHLQTLGRLVSYAENNRLSNGPPLPAPPSRNPPFSNPPNPGFAPPNRAAPNHPFSNPQTLSNPSLAPPGRALRSPPFPNPLNAQNPIPASAYLAPQQSQRPPSPQYPSSPQSQFWQGLSMSEVPQNLRAPPVSTEPPASYSRTVNPQTHFTPGFHSGLSPASSSGVTSRLLGTAGNLQSLFPAATPGPGPVSVQEVSSSGLAYHQSAPQRGLGQPWKQEAPQQGLRYGEPLHREYSQGWRGPVTPNAAAQVERSWGPPENASDAVTGTLYASRQGGTLEQTNQRGYSRNQGGGQTGEAGYHWSGEDLEAAAWSGLHSASAGFALQVAQDRYPAGERDPGQMERNSYRGSQQ